MAKETTCTLYTLLFRLKYYDIRLYCYYRTQRDACCIAGWFWAKYTYKLNRVQ